MTPDRELELQQRITKALELYAMEAKDAERLRAENDGLRAALRKIVQFASGGTSSRTFDIHYVATNALEFPLGKESPPPPSIVADMPRSGDQLADLEQSASKSAVMPQTGITGGGVAPVVGPRDTSASPSSRIAACIDAGECQRRNLEAATLNAVASEVSAIVDYLRTEAARLRGRNVGDDVGIAAHLEIVSDRLVCGAHHLPTANAKTSGDDASGSCVRYATSEASSLDATVSTTTPARGPDRGRRYPSAEELASRTPCGVCDGYDSPTASWHRGGCPREVKP